MIILGIVGSVTSAALINSHREHRLTSDEAQGLADVRVVVERLGRDIRQARSIDAGATSAKLVLWIDYNSDYIKDPVHQPDEIVTWQLQAQGGGSNQYNVLRQTTPTSVRVEARTLVSDISFHYFAASGSELRGDQRPVVQRFQDGDRSDGRPEVQRDDRCRDGPSDHIQRATPEREVSRRVSPNPRAPEGTTARDCVTTIAGSRWSSCSACPSSSRRSSR